MKKIIKGVFVIVMLLIALSETVNAQASYALGTKTKFSYDQSLLIPWAPTTIPGGDSTITSGAFSITKYDGQATIQAFYYIRKSSADGKPRVTTFLYGSEIEEPTSAQLVIVDTLGAVKDSLETLVSGSVDFKTTKYPFYFLKLRGDTGNTTDVVYSLKLFFTKPEEL